MGSTRTVYTVIAPASFSFRIRSVALGLDKPICAARSRTVKALGAVGLLLKDAALEHIIIMAIVGAAALGRIDAYQHAKTVDETLRVRKFGAAGQRPFGNEGFEFVAI